MEIKVITSPYSEYRFKIILQDRLGVSYVQGRYKSIKGAQQCIVRLQAAGHTIAAAQQTRLV